LEDKVKNKKKIKKRLKNQKHLLKIQNPKYNLDRAYYEGTIRALEWALSDKPIFGWDATNK
tara:strand:- start:2375 stop:2557 length:183 start_codon:yes stop_codon:yes gene_type:complete